MTYEEEITDDLTQRRMHQLIFNAVRSGVKMSEDIYITMSLEKMEEALNNSTRVRSTDRFGVVCYDLPMGSVTLLAISEETNIVTVHQ